MAQTDKDPLKTQNKQTVPIDLSKGGATLTCQWMLEKSKSLPICTGNQLSAYICGKEGFAAIAADIEAAKESIDLICWGFDPGMALVRNQSSPTYPWAKGEPYGELLKRKAAQGVKVRLLVWYSPKGSAKQNSLVGYVNPAEFVAGGVINRTNAEMRPAAYFKQSVAEQRQDYCTLWWRQATAKQIPNLEVRCRDGVSDKVKASLATERDKPSAAGGKVGPWLDEKDLLEKWATHHQKSIVFDYAHQQGQRAVGYVMGLNSVSDYWDSDTHQADDLERELDFSGSSDEAAKAARQKGQPISRKPLRDYAFRLEGLVLADVYLNFYSAWNRADLLPLLRAISNAKANPLKTLDAPSAKPVPAALAKRGKDAQALRLQVLRTQPEEGYDDEAQSFAHDKSIKRAYFQASSFARSYIYLENQYFFYEEWASHLKTMRLAFMKGTQDGGKACQDARLLHLMAVIPKPEEDGMLPRTYDMLKSLGQGNSLPHQKKVAEDKWALSPAHADVKASASKVKEPTLNAEGVLMQDGKSLGLKTLICKMAAPNKEAVKGMGAARDIYIHSKLLMIDDSFMTLGSANMNQRSMAADSEINVATDSIPHTRALRQRVWGQQTGGTLDGGSGTPGPDQMKKLFKDWENLAAANAAWIKERSPSKMNGFLVKFSHDGTAVVRVG